MAGHNSCELHRHLDSVPPETPIRDIVDQCGRVMWIRRFGGLVNRDPNRSSRPMWLAILTGG